MRKEEHLKIVNELTKTIETLQKRIAELSAENTKLDLNLKVQQFISDKNRDIINKMLAKDLQNINFMVEYDKKTKESFNVIMDRIKSDDEKFNTLTNYIKNVFPEFVMESKDETKQRMENKDDKLSQIFIGENGEMYQPYHVVDLAILIMSTYKKKLKEILGGDDFNTDNNNED